MVKLLIQNLSLGGQTHLHTNEHNFLFVRYANTKARREELLELNELQNWPGRGQEVSRHLQSTDTEEMAAR